MDRLSDSSCAEGRQATAAAISSCSSLSWRPRRAARGSVLRPGPARGRRPSTPYWTHPNQVLQRGQFAGETARTTCAGRPPDSKRIMRSASWRTGRSDRGSSPSPCESPRDGQLLQQREGLQHGSDIGELQPGDLALLAGDVGEEQGPQCGESRGASARMSQRRVRLSSYHQGPMTRARTSVAPGPRSFATGRRTTWTRPRGSQAPGHGARCRKCLFGPLRKGVDGQPVERLEVIGERHRVLIPRRR